MNSPPPAQDTINLRASRRSKLVVLGFGLAVAITLYFAIAMPGMDHSTSTNSLSSTRHNTEATPLGWVRQGVADFGRTVRDDAYLVINVHTPHQGSITGTDAAVPYTDILSNSSLPADRGAPIALYCRSGSMSTIAARTLADAGYTDVVELEGGMNAWQQAGNELQP
ncbi:MAG: rhodanese-like domain-containing protein [Acidimicrobiales bacterium]